MTRKTQMLIATSTAILAAPLAIAGHDPVVTFEPGFVPPVFQNTETSESSGATATSSQKNEATEASEATVVSAAATKSVTDALTLANAICFGGASEYLVSCLGSQLADIADSMPKTGDYAESARILKDASDKLNALARENRARGKPTIRYSAKVGDKSILTGSLIAVQTASIPSVNQRAEAILQEAETLLLRSTSNSDRRRSHYAAMSRVVGSSKVLLRSL